MKPWAGLISLVVVLGALVVLTTSRAPDGEAPPVQDGIISLSPSVTETLFALGLQGRLVGVTTACDYPAEAETIRRIGDFAAPRMDLIHALKPTLVIGNDLRDPEVAEAIRKTGARLLLVSQASLDEVVESTRIIGEAAGVPEVGEAYARKLLARIRAATADVPDAMRPRVYLELSAHPLRTAAKGSFVDDIIHRAGGRNIAHAMENPWTTISPDLVIQSDPQIIIVSYGMGIGDEQSVEERIGWKQLSAVRTGHVIASLNMDHLLRPGPRLADGLEALAKLFETYRQEHLK
jgi:iron complex transport system substrate-binding protein